jgi:hypothetical protein
MILDLNFLSTRQDLFLPCVFPYLTYLSQLTPNLKNVKFGVCIIFFVHLQCNQKYIDMKTYFIDFIIQLSDGSVIFSQTFSVTARNIDSATIYLRNDLRFLSDNLPADFYVVYDLTKIYSDGK